MPAKTPQVSGALYKKDATQYTFADVVRDYEDQQPYVLPSGGDIQVIAAKDACAELEKETEFEDAETRLFPDSARPRAREYRACWTVNRHDDKSLWIDIGTFWLYGVLAVADERGSSPFAPFAGAVQKLQLLGKGMLPGVTVKDLCLAELQTDCRQCRFMIDVVGADGMAAVFDHHQVDGYGERVAGGSAPDRRALPVRLNAHSIVDVSGNSAGHGRTNLTGFGAVPGPSTVSPKQPLVDIAPPHLDHSGDHEPPLPKQIGTGTGCLIGKNGDRFQTGSRPVSPPPCTVLHVLTLCL